MAIIKCKMCGGELSITEGVSVATCEYCGTTQTLPKLDDERRANLYDRASHFRRNNEFDKAAGLYNQILNEDPTDAEAYWSLVLCKYGIEYVEDPTTRKRIPTVNRAQFTSVVADEDYKKAVEHADALSRSLYEQEAHAIDEIQKGILAISSQEDPFDVFICYKETDRNGRRTPDSVLANDLYHQLTQEGFKVFFARITLEDKLGAAYEPYIFAALNSAKVMVALGTKPEYFNAVWVKNEWSRYLSLIRGGAKKVLIPAYRDMDPYDLPEEFSHLQAQDMSKLGFMQDLIRGIKKIAGAEQPKTIVKETVTVAAGADTAPLLRRVALFLEDGNWTEADTYCERVLDMDPENAQAYVGKLMAELRVKQQADLANQQEPFDSRNNYQKALRFADDKLATELKGYITHINERNEETRLNNLYTTACSRMNNANNEDDYLRAAINFDDISGYRDAWEKAAECREKAAQWKAQAKIARREDIYGRATRMMENATLSDYNAATNLFEQIPDWKDAAEKAKECREKAEILHKDNFYAAGVKAAATDDVPELRMAISYFKQIPNWKDANEKLDQCQQRIKELEEAEKLSYYNTACMLMEAGGIDDLETACTYFKYHLQGWRDAADKLKDCQQRINELECIEAKKAEAARLAAKKKKKRNTILVLTALVLIAAAALAYVFVLQPMMEYKAAEELLATGDYDGAIAAFEELGDYKDAPERAIEARNIQKEEKQAKERAEKEATYAEAESLLAAGDYDGAVAAFSALNSYSDAAERIPEVWYTKAESLLADGENPAAAMSFAKAGNYNDARERSLSLWDEIAQRETIAAGNTHTVGLRTDGTVVAVGNNKSGQCNVNSWSNIIAVSAGRDHTVGLRADGTVVAVGKKDNGRCDVSGWHDIVAISAGEYHTVGLRADGTVVAVGFNDYDNCDVNEWRNIIAISAGTTHTVGLCADGTVMAVGSNQFRQCSVQNWHDIVALSAGISRTIGVRADGTVVAVGDNHYGQCDVESWTNIMMTASRSWHTIGLHADGTVVAIGNNETDQCAVSDWNEIAAVSAYEWHTVGLRTDGTVVAVGKNGNGQCDVSNWTDIKLPTA